ncbi:hypothetical protein JCM10296v2_007739 [Rhodotorula toruloides]
MEQEYVQVVRSFEWERAIKLVHALIPKTDTKNLYKLTETDLKCLKAQIKRNPYARKTGAPMQLFNEAAVESLALRVLGALDKRAASAASAASARQRNGTTSGRSSKKASTSTGPEKPDLASMSPLERVLWYQQMMVQGYDWFGKEDDEFHECG